MFDFEEHLELMREKRAYRALVLSTWAHENRDEKGVAGAESKVFVRRLLAAPGEDECMPNDVAVAVRQLVAMGVLEPESDPKTFVLTGAGEGR